MSPWIRLAEDGNRYTRRKLTLLLFLGIGSTLIAPRNLFFAFVKISDGKAWDGAGDLVAGLLFVLFAVIDFVTIWKNWRERPPEKNA
jgi:uncharacterized membrane protein